MVDLLAAPDKRGFAGAQSLEPAAAPALAEHTKGPDRRRQSFELDLTETLVLEQPADQPPRILGNDDFVRLGEHLQSRGKVWRLADDRLLSGGPRSDQIADHREPGSKADTDFQQLACFKSAYRLDHGEAGAHRALRIILMRNRVAEIGEHAIAHVPGDEPIELADDIVDGAKVLVDNLAQILGVEPHGERGRANEIAEHYCEGPALGSWCSRSSLRCDINVAAQRGDRFEKLAAVASKHDTEVLEILCCELGQRVPIYIIVAESGLISFKTQAPQPRGYVHQAPSSSSSSAFASLRSGVPKPSVNQTETGARRSRASARRPWSRRSLARLTAARNSQSLASCSRAMLRALRYSISASSVCPCRSNNRPLSLFSSATNQRSPVLSIIREASSNRVTPSSSCPAISHASARRVV